MSSCFYYLYNLKIIDEIIPEPLGGAHRDKELILRNVKNSIEKNLDFFSSMEQEEILLHRKNKFLSIGRNKGFTTKSSDHKSLSMQENYFDKFRKFFVNYKKEIFIICLVVFIIYIIFQL